MAINSVNLGTDSVIGVGTVGATVGGAFTPIGGVFSGSMTIEHSEVDTTNNDDSGFTSFRPGNTTISLSLECRYDSSDDTAQATIEAIAVDLDNGGGSFKAPKAWQVFPNGSSSGESEFTFDGYVTSFEVNPGANDEPVNVSLEIKSIGASLATTAPAYRTVP